jgi:hypothetical protein
LGGEIVSNPFKKKESKYQNISLRVNEEQLKAIEFIGEVLKMTDEKGEVVKSEVLKFGLELAYDKAYNKKNPYKTVRGEEAKKLNKIEDGYFCPSPKKD